MRADWGLFACVWSTRTVVCPAGACHPPDLSRRRCRRFVPVCAQADWKIPPSISNWKNPKGYTIPLDKRLAADGRGLQEVQINDNFAKLSEALAIRITALGPDHVVRSSFSGGS